MALLKTSADLFNAKLIEKTSVSDIGNLSKAYSIGITTDVLQTIKVASNNDPVYKQYVPDLRENQNTLDENNDPIGDEPHEVTKGLIHRYPDRVLFKVTPTCAVYCRFCFRREMVGRGKDALSMTDIDNALHYIEQKPQLREVILSGGDPLILSPRRLKNIMERLNRIPHIKLIRFHTRIPVAQPSLITEELLNALLSEKQIIFVIHINHVQELNADVRIAVKKLSQRGTLRSQTVLLKEVNDCPDTLCRLFTCLSEMGVQPYYLHHPDKANGTSHFRVTIKDGKKIYNNLRGKISGHSLPQYVLDIPGGHGKVPVNADWIVPAEDGSYNVSDIKGHIHKYYD